MSVARVVYEDLWERRDNFTVPGRTDERGQPVRVFPAGCTPSEFDEWLVPMIAPAGTGGDDVEPEPILIVPGGGIGG